MTESSKQPVKPEKEKLASPRDSSDCFARWLLRTMSIATLMMALGFGLLLIGGWLSEIIQKKWGGDDDWALLMLPGGIITGLFLGIRYQSKSWFQVLSVGMGVIFLVEIGMVSMILLSNESGLGASIARGIASEVLTFVAIAACISFCLAGLVNTIVSFRQKRSREVIAKNTKVDRTEGF